MNDILIIFSLSDVKISLFFFSGVQNQPANKKADNGSSWLLLERVEEKQPSCFVESSAMFEPQTRSLPTSACNSDSSTTLPAWLQQCKQENRSKTSNDQVLIKSQLKVLTYNEYWYINILACRILDTYICMYAELILVCTIDI